MTAAVRNLLLGLAVVLVCSVSYYFAIALPAHHRRVLEFEREKFKQEQATKSAEWENARNEAEYRERMLDQCSDAAEKEYWSYVKLNGTPRANRPDVWDAPTGVWERADKKKAAALAECHRKYGGRP